MTRVLVVDDEPAIGRALSVNLSERGFVVEVATSGEQALEATDRERPDVVVLDLGLPGIGGLEVLRRMRRWSQVPVVVLSARTSEMDKISALDAGADDYVTKPFSINELMARIRACLRRNAVGVDSPSLHTADFDLDFADRTAIRRDGTEVRLTPTEWQIIEYMVRHEGRLVTQLQLLQHIWNSPVDINSNLIRVHLANLRKKLEPDSSQPKYFVTEPRLGYRFFSHAD